MRSVLSLVKVVPGAARRALFLGSILAMGVLLSLLSQPVRAEGGGQAGQLFSYGAGARALGMGGAFFAVADDASALVWNPAGLPQLERKELTLMQATLFADTKLQFLSYAHPTATGGTFSIGMTQLVSTGFERVSVTVDPTSGDPISVQSLGSFDSVERGMMLGWGRRITEDLSFGASFKHLSRQLDTSKDSMMALDLAALHKVGKVARVAVGLQNVAARSSGDTDDKLPMVLKVGGSLGMLKDRLRLALDAQRPQDGALSWRLGGEYWLMDWAAMRFGVLGAPALQETSFGFGLKYRYLSFDLAQGIHNLGTTTRASVSTRFGDSNTERHGVEVRRLMGDALRAFRAGDFSRAVDMMSRAADVDPGNQELRRMLRRLETAIGFVPQATGGDEVSLFTRKGVVQFVDGRDLKGSVNSLRYAFNKSPRDEKLLALLNLVEREAGVPELTRKPDGPEIFTFVDQKIYDSRQAIYEGKYDAAVRRSMDVLDLEPRNETALEILGSAFYLMDQKAKARQVWLKVLEINPENKIVAEFLQKVQ